MFYHGFVSLGVFLMHVAVIWVVIVNACVQPLQLMLKSVTYGEQVSSGDHSSFVVSD
jgi:hypothetical protein